MIRVMALAAGVCGAATFSQAPEFAQQYEQRLGGAVDALHQVVADFDASAQAEGLSRADALASMIGSDFVARRRADMERTIDRYDRLSSDLAKLKTPGGALMLNFDPTLAKQTWTAFKPAAPLTPSGIGFGAAGFVSGLTLWIVLVKTVSSLSRPARRTA